MNTQAVSLLILTLFLATATPAAAGGKPAKDLPEVPPGFVATLFAREPLVRHPCSMAFDAKGRLFVGMGPQFRMPRPNTPGDSVVMVLDTDGDGVADKVKVFATGFNCIQSLAWHGRDLWVANSPDLTIVRDLDGDDEADEYVRVYTDLGNLEHGLHGLNWAPDGKLYMSKGNSKGLTLPGRIAPKAMRDLTGVPAPPGSPDFPAPITYRKGAYQHAYQDPNDDWGREGGVLRCDDGGKNQCWVYGFCELSLRQEAQERRIRGNDYTFETFRSNPVGNQSHPARSSQPPEASLASWSAMTRAKRRQPAPRPCH